jgi:hypothetical protein
LALHAPHCFVIPLAPHFRAPHVMAQPPSAAAVTTAQARVLVSVEEREFIVVLSID